MFWSLRLGFQIVGMRAFFLVACRDFSMCGQSCDSDQGVGFGRFGPEMNPLPNLNIY